MDEQRTHEFRKARRAACRAERDPADPVAFEFEHEETGEVKFIEAIQVEIGFQEENPRWQLIGPVYPQAPVVAGNPSDQMREALRMYMSAGSGNSTDFDLQAKAWSMAHEALNHTPDTGKMVDHAGDANKIANAPGALRLADRILIADEYERRFRQIDLINSRLISENEQLNADMQELVKVAHDFDEALGELGIHCECGLRDCRTTRLRAVLVKHGGTS
ncbi:MAG: hypothetical protein U1D54_03870 [Limnobacter sp.]|nr:hypothetical protein [Limnobacter sp.]